MKTIGPALDRGLRAARSAMGPQRYRSAGKAIICYHCGGDLFVPQLTLAGHALDCTHCASRLYFGRRPEMEETADAGARIVPEGNA